MSFGDKLKMNKDNKSIWFPNGKKAADMIVVENIIFFVLNIIFFVFLLIFVYGSGNNKMIHEQSYAKDIALIIDNGSPGMSVLLNVKDAVEIAKGNNFPADRIFTLDKKNNKVLVTLAEKGGYAYQYFSGNDANLSLDKEWLLIEVNKTSGK
jgi:hypothetical protein